MQVDFGGASGYIFPSDVQATILKYKNSGELGRGKKFTKGGREKEKLGKGDGEGKEKFYFFLPRPPPPPTFCHSRPNSPSLQ